MTNSLQGILLASGLALTVAGANALAWVISTRAQRTIAIPCLIVVVAGWVATRYGRGSIWHHNAQLIGSILLLLPIVYGVTTYFAGKPGEVLNWFLLTNSLALAVWGGVLAAGDGKVRF